MLHITAVLAPNRVTGKDVINDTNFTSTTLTDRHGKLL